MRLLSLVMLLALFGCSSATMIKSNPPGARVFIDGIERGVTPLEYSDAALMGTSKMLRIELTGYKPIDAIIRKDTAKPDAIAGACLVGVPALWMLGYQKEYFFNLERLEDPSVQYPPQNTAMPSN